MCTYSPFLSGRAQRNSLALRTDLSYLIASTEAAATTTTEGAPGPVPRTHPARQNSLSAETLQTLGECCSGIAGRERAVAKVTT